MIRKILVGLAALIAWAVSATVFNILLRAALPGYAAAEPTMDFTLAMMIGRLLVGAAASVVTGAVAARLAPTAQRLPLGVGIILVVAFVPVHYGLWATFPVWYHLVFLGSLIPMVLTGAKVAKPRI